MCTGWQGFFILTGDLLRACNSIPSIAHLCLVKMKNLLSSECIFITKKMDTKCSLLWQQQFVSCTTVFAGSRKRLLQLSRPHPLSCIFKSIMHTTSLMLPTTFCLGCAIISWENGGSQTWMDCYIRYCRKSMLGSWELLLHIAGSYPSCLISSNCLFNIFLRPGSCVQSLAWLIVSI